MEVLLGIAAAAAAAERAGCSTTPRRSTGGKILSTRERMEEHRKNPACTSCHQVIDPLGLALENFDVTGAWRIKDNEVPVDSIGDLYDGTKMDGPAGLREAMLKHPDVFLAQLHREPDDLRARPPRRVRRHAGGPRASSATRRKSDNRMSSFILGVVNSAAFRMAKPDSRP